VNKTKLSYSPSKTEFILLMTLLIVAIAALAINYVLLPAWNDFNDSVDRYENQQVLVANLRNEYAKLDAYKEEDAQLVADLESLRKALPSYFSEEEIITSLDDNSDSSGLELLGITFSGVNTDTQAAFIAGLRLSSSGAGTVTATQGQSSENNILSERISVNFTGTYENYIDFLSAFEAQARQVYFREATLSRTDEGTLNGSLTILVFSSAQEDAEGAEYPGYEFDAPTATGKGDPFLAFPGYEEVSDNGSSTLRRRIFTSFSTHTTTMPIRS